MRDYKFRGKRIDNGEWVYGYLATSLKSGEYAGIVDINGFLHSKACIGEAIQWAIPETVGQYIQTINGYEIYAGDIVKAYKYGDKETEPFINAISFKNGTYWFGNWTWIEFLQTFRCVEVVRDIHDKFENPELLGDSLKSK